MRSLFGRSAIAITLSCAITPAMPAQRVAVESSPAPTDVLSRPVTVTLDRVSLEHAVRALAASANVNISYQARVFDRTEKVITLHVTKLPLSQALDSVLQSTGLRGEVVAPGNINIGVDQPSHLGDGIILGKVIDASTGHPLGGVVISLDGAQRGVTTGDDGTFRLTGLSAGTHRITTRMLGRVRQAKTVQVRDAEMATIEFRLERQVAALDQVVVTGTIVATELKTIPNAITIITAKQLEERNITRIDQLFRGDIPGLFAPNLGTGSEIDRVEVFSRGATYMAKASGLKTAMKTYLDGIEMADAAYVNQIDPRSIERIEILAGPQASTIYGSNAINGVMQIFTKRGKTNRQQWSFTLLSGLIQNNFSSNLTPQHEYSGQVGGTEGKISYNVGGSWNHLGAWSPAKKTSRRNGFGGLHWQQGIVTADATFRQSFTQNQNVGGALQIDMEKQATGEWGNEFQRSVPSPLTVATADGRTIGMTLGVTPFSWWSHNISYGSDAITTESQRKAFGYNYVGDTLLSLTHSGSTRTSLRYTNTANIRLGSAFQATLTTGADEWQALDNSMSADPLALTGTLTGAPIIIRETDHNTGVFLQSQLSIVDALFLTYGLRAEWNPNYGKEASPNVVPRYGMAYSREFGAVTAKLRASYGQSTRPPMIDQKRALKQTQQFRIDVYGPHDDRLANPALGPEFQKGGEGGLELYLGNRASLAVTRYNQTVNGLIALVPGADSVRSLTPNPIFFGVYTCADLILLNLPTYCSSQDASGYGYSIVNQNLNVGSVRNQGWESQASLVTGPLTTRGTYSWTKSRVIGVTPKYRSLLQGGLYQVGRSVQTLAEHTWALTFSYVQARSSVSLNVNGIGPMMRFENELTAAIDYSRLYQDKPRTSNPWSSANSYPTPGYTQADLNVAHRLSNTIEGVLQVQNLSNYYHNDYNERFATIGRQTKVGMRVRF
jgi:outer membrane receptor protein involved in Fe transport